ncbi:phosphatidylinositol N-acetylglucosaminyltransferase subunit P [Elysia marginata]|uniref:Phosphatidylinositol N-acetylglucosaminyltransferase subunit P n=1 Tax=Elysia marginata TaxID=1093978 RepID=A0AAV4GS60_9GAST|nr:phosphatidylinositol N-acetylglucosaminyltransferase subunit P [Elysia marginata]
MTQEHSPSPTPLRAIYGFALYIASFALFGLYIVWAYVPDPWLHWLGLTYWPQKYWAVALPVYFCVAIVLSYVAYVGLIFQQTAPLSDMSTITDPHAIYPDDTEFPVDAIPPLRDLSISDVNKKIYGKKS